MEKSNFLQKIPLESGLTTHFGYMGVHIEKPHGHFFCTSYYPKYRHLDQCGLENKNLLKNAVSRIFSTHSQSFPFYIYRKSYIGKTSMNR